MSHGVRGHYLRQRCLMALVVLLQQALEHGIVVCRRFWQAVPVQEQKMRVSINDNRFSTLAVLQDTLERFAGGCGHWYLPDAAFRLGCLNVEAVLCAP